MNLNFPLILVCGVFVMGLVWLIDALWLSKRRQLKEQRSGEEVSEPLLVEYSKSFFPVLLVVLLLRSFLVEPFQIPSGSMLPTLQIGDFILVNKFAYGLRLPVADTKVVEIGEPKRGDVMVFRYPDDPKINYIKRVIGLPGDRIAYKNKMIYVNGVKAEQTFVSEKWFPHSQLLQERLGDVSHSIYVDVAVAAIDVEVVVPAGKYFMMGDNRDNSNDGRYWGFVPEANIVGKAFAVWLHWDTFFSLPSFSRNGVIR
jgi:signal peptidase I